MRTEQEVLERFHEMRTRKLREQKDKRLSHSYINCIHNVRLMVRKVGRVGICQNPDLLKKRGKPLVCNDDEFSCACSCFSCCHTEESVEQEFDEILRSPSRCGEEHPKLAILIWFLQGRDNKESRWQKLKGHCSRSISELGKVLTLRWL